MKVFISLSITYGYSHLLSGQTLDDSKFLLNNPPVIQ